MHMLICREGTELPPMLVTEIVPGSRKYTTRQKTISTSKAAFKWFRPTMEHSPIEMFAVLILDTQHKGKGLAPISQGSLSWSVVHPREVYGPAIRYGAAAIIVAHNHPSGDPKPSRDDIEVTKRLVDAGELLGIPLLDHIIVGANGRYSSLMDRGLM